MSDSKNIKRLLTIDDLVKFCSEQNFTKFCSKETGYKLSVQVPATFEVDDNVDDNHRGMMKLKFRIFHTGLNRNGSFVSEDAAKKAMPTIKNRPILAHIHQLDDGEWDFESHNMEIITNEDGEEEINYIEHQVGSFSEGDPFFEYDEELDKTYVCAYGYIPEEYTKSCDIIRRKNGSKNSCELSIDELAYNAKEHYLDLQAFYVMGSTLLGSRKDGTEIGEGMLGSRADIADFSEQNNSLFSSENKKLIEMLERLNTKIDNLSNFTIQGDTQPKLEEGGNETVKFQELLLKYGKTVEDITFEYENLSDEELELKFEEVFGDDGAEGEGDTDPEPTSDGDNGEGSDDGDSGENSEDGSGEGSDEDSDDGEGQEDSVVTNDAGIIGTYSVEKLIKTYEISHEDIRCALYGLLVSYEEMDNEWYFINSVYDTYFTYENWYGDKIFGQAYVKDGDNVSFDGERYNLHRELLTDQEYAELVSMRSNYEALVQFKEETESAQLHSQREAVLYDSKYSVLAEKNENNEYKNASYAKLVSEMDNYSLVDLEKELKSVFADYITNGGKFAYSGEQNVKPVTSKKIFTNTDNKEKKSSRYGNLFKNK